MKVTPSGLDGSPLRDARVDPPRSEPGQGLDLELTGWAVSSEREAVAAELIHQGTCVARAPVGLPRPDAAAALPGVTGADRSGFRASVGALALPPRFELVLRIVLADKTRVPIATVAGGRPELRARGEARLAPLMVTALGRTGSTIVVHVLERHPEIVAYRPFLYEPRAASYWTGVLRALVDPRTRVRQLQGPPGGDRSEASSWWLGTPVPTVDELIAARGAGEAGGEQGSRDGASVGENAHDGASAVEGAAQRALAAGAGIAELAAFCRGRIDALYEQVARLREKPEAAFFAEKLVPDWVPDVLWELYPRGREVLLVRDFRDMVASIFAFNRKRGFQGFQRDRLSSDEQYVFEQVADSVAALTRSLERRAERAHVLRYEDLVLEPQRTLADTLGYLGLDASAETVEAMAAGLEQGPSEMEAHMTAASARDSIGRWRGDLEPALQDACEQALAPALDRFGYS